MKVSEDNSYPALVAGTLAATVLVSAAAAFFFSPRFSLSVLAGGVLATANFCWLRAGLVAALAAGEGRAPRFAVLRHLARLALVGLFLYLLIVKLKADVFGLLTGLSLLVVTLVIFSVYISTRKGG